MSLFMTSLVAPIGRLHVYVDERGRVARIDLPGSARPANDVPAEDGRCAAVVRQLGEYFAGRRRTFELELAAAGTEFQQRVWRQLQAIPFGATISYRQLAERLGQPSAMRAVGAANGRNPIPIVVPCHRVIGADGRLVGFGGGLACKQQLLELEGLAVRDGRVVAAAAGG